MARWGQGDPRWIVEEREDGTNVNNWHWTERDATSLSKGKLRDLLVGIVVENETGHRVISELKQVEGEASCSSHKGKLIFFYEWNIRLSWKGNGAQGTARAGGSLGAELVHLSFTCSADIFRTDISLALIGP
uniref:Activator of Hsp90 ATPase AHSA1-like N-terminal domain-containing protein n=1 Tax=Panthera leo TaxID=9689 RepID=A0A8C8WC02_PANLE